MKAVFLPLVDSLSGWTPRRARLLGRFAHATHDEVTCQCGASYTIKHGWQPDLGDALYAWGDRHGPHMPALPHEPPEHGNLLEQDDAGNTLSMVPALRYPDGRVEAVRQVIAASPTPDLWSEFHAAGFTDIWYAHPGPKPYAHYQTGEVRERFGPRWHAGVWTGPDRDLLCVKPCDTAEDAERWLSPGGHSPEGAVRIALAKRSLLNEGST